MFRSLADDQASGKDIFKERHDNKFDKISVSKEYSLERDDMMIFNS